LKLTVGKLPFFDFLNAQLKILAKKIGMTIICPIRKILSEFSGVKSY